MVTESRIPASRGRIIRLGMLACCAVMLLPLGAFLIAGGTFTGLATDVGLLAPLALCLAAHFVMHRMMGKSCHDSASTSDGEHGTQDLPAVVRSDATR